MTHPRRASGTVALLVALLPALAATAATAAADGDRPYAVRGHQVDARQRANHDRVDALFRSLQTLLSARAPGLLPRIAPPPPTTAGYGILPRLIPDATRPRVAPEPTVARYSWDRTLAQMDNAERDLDALETVLSNLAGARRVRRPALEDAIRRYRAVVERRTRLDAGVDYNWLWQRRIDADRRLFDRLTQALDIAVARRAATPGTTGTPATDGTSAIGFDPPLFLTVSDEATHALVRVRLYTDIDDAAFVGHVVSAIERHWRTRDDRRRYAVRLDVVRLTPAALYCGVRAVSPADTSATPCRPPAPREPIDVTAHVARFPSDGVVLTTGAASLQTSGPRALVLSPHEVSGRTLAHEFGHLLGFPDAYLRGYRDLGEAGFEVQEYVPDLTDLMASPGYGSVSVSHFERLLTAYTIRQRMDDGLSALYTRHDAPTAVERFRDVLARNPGHYGARVQLAKALDTAGRPADARPVWEAVLAAAEGIGDSATVLMARTRLGEPR